jgi:hypothetical protein
MIGYRFNQGRINGRMASRSHSLTGVRSRALSSAAASRGVSSVRTRRQAA